MSTRTPDRRALPAPLLDDAAGHVAPLGRPSSPPLTAEPQASADCTAATGRRRFRRPAIAAITAMILVGSSASLALTVADAPPLARVSSEPLGASIAQTSSRIAHLLERATAAHAAAQRAAQRRLVAARRARAQRRAAQRRRAARQRAAAKRAAARRTVASRPRRAAPPPPPVAPARPAPAPEFAF